MRKPGQGRKPLPTSLKVLKGTDQPCRTNEREPVVGSENIEPPIKLSPEAAKHWEKVLKQLSEARIVTDIDSTALAAYCEAFATWSEALKMVRRLGSVVKGERGFPVKSPYLDVADKASKEMRALLTEFGMTPSSRTRIQATEKPQTKSKWKKISNA